MIEITQISKTFSRSARVRAFARGSHIETEEDRVVRAVDGVTFEVRQGEIFGLLGPNGAGKTTLLKIICTLILPTEGGGIVNGFDLLREDRRVRESIGFLPSTERSFYYRLTGRQNLTFFGLLYNIPKARLKRRISELLKLMGLEEKAEEKYMKYSSGEKQKLALARCILVDPPVLILDEPTVSLDPTAARSFRQFVLSLKKRGKAILLATHNMYEADKLCDRVAIMDSGKVVALDAPSTLKRKLASDGVMLLTLAEERKTLIEKLRALRTVIEIRREKETNCYHIFIRDGKKTAERVLKICSEYGMIIRHIAFKEPTLEDVFFSITGGKIE